MRESSAGSARAKTRPERQPYTGYDLAPIESGNSSSAKDAPKTNPNRLRKKPRVVREPEPTGDAVSAFDDFFPDDL